MQIDKLSSRQKRILSFVHLNAAASYEEIAKACGTKVHNARFELTNLIECKIISPCILVNYASIGIQKNHIYFSTIPLSEEKRKSFIEYISNHPRVAWLCDFSGEFDFGITFMSKNLEDLDRNLRQFMSKFQGIIKKRQIAVNLSWNYFGKKYIFNNELLSPPVLINYPQKIIEIDKIDTSILKILAIDSFTPQQKIALELKIPLSTVNNRITMMQKKGIIAGYVYWISYSKMKINAYRVLFDFGGLTDSLINKLKKYCQAHPNIVSLIFTLGSWDMELGLDLEDKYMIHNIISEIQSLIKSPTLSTISLVRYDDIKWNTICPGVFE
jgi:DNA-binding Lrp family transcriptional regulator